MLLVTHDLVVLVPLARNQDEVTGAREPDRERDRRPAVRLDHVATTVLPETHESRPGDPGLDGVEDTPRVLGAGIVRGEDHDVAQAGRGLSTASGRTSDVSPAPTRTQRVRTSPASRAPAGSSTFTTATASGLPLAARCSRKSRALAR